MGRYLNRSLEGLEDTAVGAARADSHQGDDDIDMRSHQEGRGGGTAGDREHKGKKRLEGWDDYTPSDRLRMSIVPRAETSLSKTVTDQAILALRRESLADLFPVRAVAAGCVFVGMKGRGIAVEGGSDDGGGEEAVARWVKDITSSKVDLDNFWDVVGILEGTK